jgi:hypothetical protein
MPGLNMLHLNVLYCIVLHQIMLFIWAGLYVTQAGLKFLNSSNFPASASWMLELQGVQPHLGYNSLTE